MTSRKMRILTIDDNQDNLISLKALINDTFPDVDVIIALSGLQGIELAIAQEPDVILLDIFMPDMDGFEVCRILKVDKRTSEIPVVFVTAVKEDTKNRIRGLECGAEGFLAKPIDESELTAQIRAMLKIRTANRDKQDEKRRLAVLVEEKTRELEKSQEETLHYCKDLLESQRIAHLGTWRLNLTTNQVVWSEELYKMYGFDPALPPPPYTEHMKLFTPDSWNKLSTALEITRTSGTPYELELKTVTKDGLNGWMWVRGEAEIDSKGAIVAIWGVAQDITEHKKAEQAIEEKTSRFYSLFDHMSSGSAIYRVINDGMSGRDFIIQDFNQTALRTEGKTKEEVTGKSLYELRPNIDDYGLISVFRKVWQTGESAFFPSKAYIDERYNNWYENRIFRLPSGEIVAIFDDVTEMKKAEENLIYLLYHDQLTNLHNRRFFEEEIRKLDKKENLPLSVIMFDVNGLKLINDSFGHINGDKLLVKLAKAIRTACEAKGLASRIGGDEFAIILPLTNAEETAHIANKIKRLASKENIKNIELSVSYGHDTKTNNKQKIIEVLANAENHMYKHKLYERSSTRSKTIDIIMNTLFEKSKRESMHSNRVGAISQAIASKMVFNKDDVNQMRIAGLIHDIGKIGIDEKILNKNGSLNGDEWEQIKKHPEIGWRILGSAIEFSELADFVLAHHERWDGKGYPNGLKGEKIPLEARIIAVADAFDAMTSQRSYRIGVTQEEAIHELKRCSGTQFDPEIVQVFVEKVIPYNSFG